MDFKKAYGDALERAKGIYNENPSSSTAKFVCGQIFPEIKESEDERIRRDICIWLKHKQETCTYPTPKKETLSAWIDYLEKQNAEFIEYGRQEYLRGRAEAIDEQQPAGWSDSAAKEMFIKALERAVEQTKKGYELTDCDKHSWWEDFKAYSGINPAKCSGEDESDIRDIIKAVEEVWDKDDANRMIRLLKSLRLAWKPSEEQMRVFFKANPVNLMPEELSVYKSLCSDIQKLM